MSINIDKFAALKAKHGIQGEHEAIDCMKPDNHVSFCERNAEMKKSIEEMQRFTSQWNSSSMGLAVLLSGLTAEEAAAAGCPPDNPIDAVGEANE